MKQFYRKGVRAQIVALCAMWMVTPGYAQFQDEVHRVDLSPQKWYTRFTHNYEPGIVRPISLANSNRLESLMRAGNLYLSLKDAVALSLENNIDIEVQRYNFMLTQTALERSKAGGNGVASLDPVFTSNLNWNHLTQAQANTITSGGLTANANGSCVSFKVIIMVVPFTRLGPYIRQLSS